MRGRLRVCSYEDRAEALDGVILMAESLCRADQEVSFHLTVPDAPAAVRSWAKSRPEVVLTTERPPEVSGWDVKPRLLLQELDAGHTQALWLDSDMIVTRPVSAIVAEFPEDPLLVAEEWNRPLPMRMADLWGMSAARAVSTVNSCFVRVTQAHRSLLLRWVAMTGEPRYREAQKLPFDQRPYYLSSDQMLLTALLSMPDFAGLRFERISMGRHIAQCAGSSGYGPADRVRDVFRGVPPLIHCIGRKPWEPGQQQSWTVKLAADLSAYVLAARKVASQLGMNSEWLRARTALGALLRRTTGEHPALAGLPLAIPHAVVQRVQMIAWQSQHK